GRGDSTNVIKAPLLSVITNVQLDHTARLGRSRAQIASHKAGIIKEGRPVLWGGGKGEAYEVIRAEAEAKHAPLYCTDLSRLTVGESSLEGTHITFSGFGELTLSLAGDYQPENAANVLTAVELLRSLGIKIEEAAVRSGLASARWPARFEPIQSDPPVVFDGAHNPDGVALAANSIKKVFKGGRAVLLMAVMADKEYAKYPDLVRGCADTVFAVTPDNPRALPAEALASCMEEGGVPARAFAEFDKGVEEAYNYAKERSLPLVALGTLYMYSQFRSAFEKISK
ncbi:MAG: bifunctional folylpolyglutamate synthase/dihydrofolate synthase, partial [Clostridia bacterium]|nr:bifunctional folylpolyglutamate synthase/dihydrofolate synthase [Clostridia bacterium]